MADTDTIPAAKTFDLAEIAARHAQHRADQAARLADIGITAALIPTGARDRMREETNRDHAMHFAVGWVQQLLYDAARTPTRANLRTAVREAAAVLAYATSDLTDAQATVDGARSANTG